MARIPFRSLNGLLLLDKAPEISSNRALQDARFTYRAKKAGHTGTLDPFATGLLPLCFGEANKYARWLFDADKTYEFEAILGKSSSTGDTEGEIITVDNNPYISREKLQAAEIFFTGLITQIPPKYSAIKIDGRRAYELARKGEAVDIPSREVTIHSLQISISENRLIGTARVSKGTYIRTLVEDIANYLGTVAYCYKLRRTQIAHLISHKQDRPMYKIEEIRELVEEKERDQLLLPIDLLCQQFPIQVIDAKQWEALTKGRQVHIENAIQGMVRLYLDGEFRGLGEVNSDQIKAFRLMNTGF